MVVAVSAAYFCYVFQVFDHAFWVSGLSAWLDPYFLNYLLEHWYYSVRNLWDPASPPMYFPTQGSIGYSCGLILYAPFYLIVRPFLHPFPAYSIALLLVVETGALCLYAILRKFVTLSLVESLLLTVFFFSSANVLNAWHTNIWSQTLSIFLVPPILLLTLTSARMPRGSASLALAALSGLLSVLLFVQDFYTGWLGALVLILLLTGFVLVTNKRVLVERLARAWRTDRGRILAFVSGGVLGALVFLRFYLGAYQEHRGFPQEQLTAALIPQDFARLGYEPFAAVRDFVVYYSARTFKLVFLLGMLVWVPWFRVPMRIRFCALWFLLISTIVVLSAIRFEEFPGGRNYSVWKWLFLPLPGSTAIRDPKRIIYAYELAAVLVTGLFLAQLPRRSVLRVSAGIVVLALLVTEPNREVFSYERSANEFTRWVDAPIDIDASCRSFFVKAASDAYTSRFFHIWGLYGIDAMFIALHHGVPTLNGYSAWTPTDWPLMNPLDPAYTVGARGWIARHDLRGVCELDIEARTMTPFD